MLYPVEKLLANRNHPLCINAKETVRDALVKMVRNDYSQLPVVDDAGNLVGIITERTITRTYYHANESVPLFNITVDHCLSPAVTLSIDRDIFEALDRLQTTYALVITEGRKPIGLLTHYDTTHFFRNLTEGLIIVEDIETTLRHYIEAIYPTEEQLTQALINRFGSNDGTPNQEYDRLSFGQYLQFIGHKKNWPDFEPYFGNQMLFDRLMNTVREIRNQIAHFRGELDILQTDALLRARDWLSSRPQPSLVTAVQPETMTATSEPTVLYILPSDKYTSLTNRLQQQWSGTQVIVTFEEIEKLLQEPLANSARQHRSWWANDTTVNRQAHAWLAAGWIVEDVDMASGNVTFRKTVSAYYQLFFEDLVQRFNVRRPGLVSTNAARPKSWLSFNAGIPGFSYGWSFSHGPVFTVYLYIATGLKETNKRYFDLLYSKRQAVETELGTELKWERLDTKGASRVRLERVNSITDSPEQIELTKAWAVDKMLALVDTFQPFLKELSFE